MSGSGCWRDTPKRHMIDNPVVVHRIAVDGARWHQTTFEIVGCVLSQRRMLHNHNSTPPLPSARSKDACASLRKAAQSVETHDHDASLRLQQIRGGTCLCLEIKLRSTHAKHIDHDAVGDIVHLRSTDPIEPSHEGHQTNAKDRQAFETSERSPRGTSEMSRTWSQNRGVTGAGQGVSTSAAGSHRR